VSFLLSARPYTGSVAGRGGPVNQAGRKR